MASGSGNISMQNAIWFAADLGYQFQTTSRIMPAVRTLDIGNIIGKKNGNIVVFNDTVENITLNAKIKGITLDSIEETEEDIVSSHTTPIDGITTKFRKFHRYRLK